jgi:hypothetical protein
MTGERFMARLDPKDRYAVLIDTFPAPERAEELMTLLERAARQTIRVQVGYVSANLHSEHRPDSIVSCARRRSRADFEAMLGPLPHEPVVAKPQGRNFVRSGDLRVGLQ